MIRAADHGRRHAQVDGRLERGVHRDPPGVVAPAVACIPVDQRRPSSDALRPCRGVHDARLDQVDVVREPGRAVGSDAADVRRDEDLGDVRRDVRRGAKVFDEPRRPGLEERDRDGETVDGIGVDRQAEIRRSMATKV